MSSTLPVLTLVKFERDREYTVRISYREPTYEEARGLSRREPFTATYRYRTGTPEEARRQAEEEFRRIERLSSVGWIREIVEVRVA